MNNRLEKAIIELKNDNKNSVSYVYENIVVQDDPSKILNQKIITLKQVFATKDVVTNGSSKLLDNFIPGYDATVVKKIQENNGLIVAKVHCDELGLGGTGEFSAWGRIDNPLNKDRMPGGSSSGSVTTLTENIDISLGTDTGNSVRLPASFTGKVGFKPSFGAVSRYGMFGFAPSLDTVGFFAHNVNDIILISEATFGKDFKDLTTREVEKPINEMKKPQKVVFLEDHNRHSKEVKAQYDKLKTILEKENITVDIHAIDEKLLKQINTVYDVISYSEVSSTDSNLTGVTFGNRFKSDDWEQMIIKTRGTYLGKMVQRRFTLGSFYLLKENQNEIFIKAQKVRRIIQETYKKLFDQYDLIVFPTSSIAPLWSEGKEDNWVIDYSTVSNLVGNPSITLPFIKEENMPVGIMLDSKIYKDKDLLSYALYFEKLIGENYE